jgi:acyl-lipid Delta6-acetylenase / acyl-lipid (9-3)-desaturase
VLFSSFAAFHRGSKESYAHLERLYVGNLERPLKDSPADSPFERDVRALGAKLAAAGLFKADPVWYFIKTASTLALGAMVVALCMWSGGGFVTKMGAALLLALFWQQCGWLSHDYGHHAVFSNRRVNDAFIVVLGSLQAFDTSWWKAKHDRHHAVPNCHETEFDAHDGDPDIDTLPFLAWSKKMARKAKETILSSSTDKKTDNNSAGTSLLAATLSKQNWMYFPLLCFARFSWAFQSWSFAFDAPTRPDPKEKDPKKQRSAPVLYPTAERIGLVLHWVLYAALIVTTMDIITGICFVLVSQLAAGFFLALVFGVGHNGMEVVENDGSRYGHYELQVRTTRDVEDTLFNGWFCGGLHYQGELL